MKEMLKSIAQKVKNGDISLLEGGSWYRQLGLEEFRIDDGVGDPYEDDELAVPDKKIKNIIDELMESYNKSGSGITMMSIDCARRGKEDIVKFAFFTPGELFWFVFKKEDFIKAVKEDL